MNQRLNQKEVNMFKVTEKANEMILEFFKDKKETPNIRIFLSQGGWSGPSLGMALDEPLEDDEILKDNGMTYLINKELFEQAKPINIDFTESEMGSGFSISSSMEAGDACGGSCSC